MPRLTNKEKRERLRQMITEKRKEEQPVTNNFGLAVHLHPDGPLFEWCYDLKERVSFISGGKQFGEQELWLNLLTLVPERKLPKTPPLAPFLGAGEAYHLAWETYIGAMKVCHLANAYRLEACRLAKAYRLAREACRLAEKACRLAEKAYLESIDPAALHRAVCKLWCPWDGNTIFAKGRDLTAVQIIMAIAIMKGALRDE